MSNSRSSSVFATSATPSPARVALVVKTAQRYGLRVNIRPALDETSLQPHGWRGSISPRDRTAWFNSYFAFMRPYLLMAQGAKAAQFQIGVELNSLSFDPHWGPLIARARSIFRGVIGYSSNWNLFQQGVLGPHSADSRGFDAYFRNHLPGNASEAQIVAEWNDWLDQVPVGVDMRKIVITEVGIAAQVGEYRRPYDVGNPGRPINVAIQQRWFTAACTIARNRHMAGIYFWSMDFNSPPGTFTAAAAAPTSFVGRGSTSIKACFKR